VCMDECMGVCMGVWICMDGCVCMYGCVCLCVEEEGESSENIWTNCRRYNHREGHVYTH